MAPESEVAAMLQEAAGSRQSGAYICSRVRYRTSKYDFVLTRLGILL